MQENIANEFAAVEAPGNLGITNVASSRSLTTYPVGSTDRYVTVDASAGPLKVVLPAPGNQQVVTVLKADSSKNAVTVVIGTGSKFNDGTHTVTVTKSA